MLKEYFEECFLQNFGFEPTEGQRKVISSLADFILSPKADSIFLLRGFAGTGKTSLIAALVKTMRQITSQESEAGTVLIAPTGRAAKVFSLYADSPAYTIHKRIYRQKSIDKDSLFSLNYNMRTNLLFVCDEASMIGNDSGAAVFASGVGPAYGTGCLLDDLVHFVYGGAGCRLIVMGDTAQLPPVGDAESPALQPEVLGGYGFEVVGHTLTEVVRQKEESGILWNATMLRRMLAEDDVYAVPPIRFAGFADVINVPGMELIEALEQCYHNDGEDETIVITRSNKRANIYNNGIRAKVLWREEEISSGDRIMVVKNNYFWCEEQKTEDFDFIANGDMAVVKRLRNERSMYGFRFVDATLEFPDYNDYEMQCTMMLDALRTDRSSLTPEQQQQLYEGVMEDYEEINTAEPGKRPVWKKATKQEKLKAMRKDPHYNALQVKYAYAVTCHKAQGGQWRNVFVDQEFVSEDMLGPEYFRWLYTAITRATGKVYLVNWKNPD